MHPPLTLAGRDVTAQTVELERNALGPSPENRVRHRHFGARSRFVFIKMDSPEVWHFVRHGLNRGGAIIRRDNLVLGVTTAATLWFVTVIGLCFGGGQIALRFAGLMIGILVLTSLRYLETLIRQDREGTLVVVLTRTGPTEGEIHGSLAAEHYRIRGCSVIYNMPDETHEWTCQVSWRSRDSGAGVPEFVRTLPHHPGVSRVSWSPQIR